MTNKSQDRIPLRMLRMPALRKKLADQGKTTIYTGIKAGLWTEPVHFGPRCSAWPEAEIDAIISARAAGADDDAIKALVKQLHAERRAALPGFTPTPAPKKARARDARGRLK
jgi:prophage regulatory protein